MEQASSFAHNIVVTRIKFLGAPRVHLNKCCGVSWLAPVLQVGYVVLVHGWVSVTSACEVVQPVCEARAVPNSNGVSSFEKKKRE